MARVEFTFKGKTYYHDAPMLTEAELDSIVGSARGGNTRLISIRPEGNYVIRKDEIDVKRDRKLDEIPEGTHKGAASRRETYIKAQVGSIAEVFGPRYGVPVQLTKDLEFLFIPRYPLPRKWGARETPILIRLPPQYPDVPPRGFFLSSKLRGPHVFSRNAYDSSEDFSQYGWNWYCALCDGGWKPGKSPLDDNNLWTFLKVVRTSLTINEF